MRMIANEDDCRGGERDEHVIVPAPSSLADSKGDSSDGVISKKLRLALTTMYSKYAQFSDFPSVVQDRFHRYALKWPALLFGYTEPALWQPPESLASVTKAPAGAAWTSDDASHDNGSEQVFALPVAAHLSGSHASAHNIKTNPTAEDDDSNAEFEVASQSESPSLAPLAHSRTGSGHRSSGPSPISWLSCTPPLGSAC